MVKGNNARKLERTQSLARDRSTQQNFSNVKIDSDVYLQALEASIDGIAILDSDENFVFINRSFANVFGYSSTKELFERNWRSLFPMSELLQIQRKLIPQLSNRGRLRQELVGIKRWGTRFPIEISLTLLEGEQTICIVKDITKRKEAENQAKLMGLFATLNPNPVMRFDASGIIIMANPAATDIFQLTQEQKISMYDLVPETRSFDLLDCITQGKVLSCTSFIKDRHYHLILRGVHPKQFGHVYAIDISELIDTKEDLYESRSFLRKVIDTDPNLIFVKDRNGRFLLANQTVADLYGTTIYDIIGKQDSDFNSNQEEIDGFLKDDREVIDYGVERRTEEEVTGADGAIHWLETVKKPFVTRNNETHVLGVGHDITDRKKLQDQLVQSQKMEAIGKLAGGIAHDFNNLLTGIIGYSTLLLNSAGHPERVIQAAEMIQKAANKAAELTQKLLGFARRGKHQHTNVDIHSTILETFQLLRRTVEENIAINEILCEDSLCVMGDPVQLQQVILNLAVNARDAIQYKSTVNSNEHITIKTNVIKLNNNDLSLPVGNYVEILVSDTGCGIEKENIEHIFEPFFTTKENQGGTGMGLAMVYGIVQNHGGIIEVTSNPGTGSSFRVLLPHSEKNKELDESKSDLIEPITGEGNILLVDDHKVIRDVTSNMLSNLGYVIVTAEDGKEAVEYYKTNSTDIDLVILDMVMPRMGAKECIVELKKINPNIKVILSTGYVNNNDVQSILDSGLAGFIQKPYDLDYLSQVVSDALTDGNC